MSENILAYTILKSANLSNKHEKLVKATLPQLQYDSVKDQPKKTFNYSSQHMPITEQSFIKIEKASLAASLDNLKQS